MSELNKKTLKKLLSENDWFRMRSNKDLGLAKLILMEHPELAITALTPEKLAHILQMYNSADRLWRLILQENEELRGTDYGDGASLEDRKLAELGYKKRRFAELKDRETGETLLTVEEL